MSTYEVVLFLHIAVAIFAFGVSAVLHTALFRLRATTNRRELSAWMPVIKKAEPLFPISALVLFGLGAWLLQLSDGDFGWGDGWVLTAIGGLVVMEIVGGAVLGPRMKKVHAAVEADSGDTVSESTRATVTAPAIWYGAHTTTGIAVGIVLLMAAKPTTATSIAVLVVAAVLGVLSAVPFAKPVAARSSAPEAAAG